MTSCKFGTIHFVSDFYFVRQPSHRLKWQEAGRAIGGLGNIHRISHTRSFKKKGDSLIKKPGNPIGRYLRHPQIFASRPKGLLSLTI